MLFFAIKLSFRAKSFRKLCVVVVLLSSPYCERQLMDILGSSTTLA